MNEIVQSILSCFDFSDMSKYYLFGQVITNFVWGFCLLSYSSPITSNNFWEEILRRFNRHKLYNANYHDFCNPQLLKQMGTAKRYGLPNVKMIY